MAIQYRNTWGSANSNLDQQRGDLFRIAINLPDALGGVGAWNEAIQFAVTKFPFPAREREMIPTKYLNQTNFQLGPDAPSGTVTIPIRYAFNQQTAVLLEQWHWMTSHPGTGGVAITSQIKTNGYFYWLVPNMTGAPTSINDPVTTSLFLDGGAYALEGCMVKDFKPSGGDMEANNNLVMFDLVLQIDRYYPISPANLCVAVTEAGQNAAQASTGAAAGIVTSAFVNSATTSG